MRITTLASLLTFACLASLQAQTVSGLSVERVATGLSNPIYVTAPPGDAARLFIVQQIGQIKILDLASGALRATAFLDIGAGITQGGEQGLLGLAFDPSFAGNGKFYVYYTALGLSNQLETRVAQFGLSADLDVADAASEKILLRFDQPQSNHNGGWIGFSPRVNDANNLYIASGDGGNGNDQGPGHIEPGGNAQSYATLLGKMLRITINPAGGTYSIPANNPFVTGPAGALPEIWTNGLRNPYRASFDRQGGTLFIGDVGQGSREEVSVQQPHNPGGGENYGWRLREGDIATPGVGGARPPGNVDPVFAYDRSVGRTVLGGYIYRGRQIPALRGVYVFGDYLGADGGNNRGRIFMLNYDGSTMSNFQDITAHLFPTGGSFTLLNPSSFGEDANGELYITDISGGCVYRIAPLTPNIETSSVTKEAGTFRLLAFGVPFKPHRIEAAATLVEQFQMVATVTAAGDGTVEFQESFGVEPPQRFYRVEYP